MGLCLCHYQSTVWNRQGGLLVSSALLSCHRHKSRLTATACAHLPTSCEQSKRNVGRKEQIPQRSYGISSRGAPIVKETCVEDVDPFEEAIVPLKCFRCQNGRSAGLLLLRIHEESCYHAVAIKELRPAVDQNIAQLRDEHIKPSPVQHR